MFLVSILIGSILACNIMAHEAVPARYAKGQQVTIMHHENEYKIVSVNTPLDTAHLLYTIEQDTIIPLANGYQRTIVAVKSGEYTLAGIPLYHHELTITETHIADSHSRTIKTRMVHERASFVLCAILALSLAGIVYKIAQKVQENFKENHVI